MANKTKWFLVVSTLGALLLILVPSAALAGSNSISLPNGANLEVAIDDPVTCTEFLVPADDPDGLIDVPVEGSASIGQGDPNVLLIPVVDVSTSTNSSCGGGLGSKLSCEKLAVQNLLGSPDISSVKEFGVAIYAGASVTADMTSAGSDQKISSAVSDASTVVASIGSLNVGQYTAKNVPDATNFTAGLQQAKTIVDASTSGANIIVFLSDGLSNQGGAGFNAAVSALVGQATIFSFAVGAGSSCTGGTHGTLQAMATSTGGSCTPVPNPANLPTILPDLLSTELLSVKVNGDDATAVPSVPVDGPITVDYTATVSNLGVGDQDICAEATGSDSTGSDSVEQCEEIHLLQLTASPPNGVNDLNFDDQHTVTAAILGGTAPARDIDFVVSGTNAGTATPGNASINATPGGAAVNFNYTVPKDCASLGQDTITVSTTIAGELDSIDVTKDWIDPVPPNVSCDPTVNPHGNNEPPAPGQGGQGQNQDGFYQLNAADPYLTNCTVTLEVMDGSSYVFPGPFLPGDRIKYTQDDFAVQEQKKIGSVKGQAGAVLWHLIGHGDLTVTGTDPSGNQTSATCLVPPPPK
jgi:hypothetical protein